MENCKLIILRDNSGSGKSFVARELQHRFGRGTLMIPQDEVRRNFLYARDGMGTRALSLLILYPAPNRFGLVD